MLKEDRSKDKKQSEKKSTQNLTNLHNIKLNNFLALMTLQIKINRNLSNQNESQLAFEN